MEKIEEDLSDNVANIDMDGSTANYSKAMLEALETMRSPGEPVIEAIEFKDTPPWLDARMMYIKNRPGFWLNLEPIPLGMLVLDLIREVGFILNVLSKGPKRTHIAWMEKVQWA